MCKDCVKEAFVDRGRCALERGCYLLNFAGCIKCQRRDDFLEEKNLVHTEEQEDEAELFEETLEFNHCCKSCGHVIAKHLYGFRTNTTVQEYSMACALCGKGEDVVAVKEQQQQQQPSGRSTALPDEQQISRVQFPTVMLTSNLLIQTKSKQKKEEEDDDEWE
jgi:Churchill protein